MWQNLRGPNFNFWAEEWRKHGHNIGLSPNSYFKMALQCKALVDEKYGEIVEYFSRKGKYNTILISCMLDTYIILIYTVISIKY